MGKIQLHHKMALMLVSDIFSAALPGTGTGAFPFPFTAFYLHTESVTTKI